MNPETQQDMTPQMTEAPQTTEAPRTDIPAQEVPAAQKAPAGKKEKGLLGKYIDVWTDRDLNTEDSDTSDWNIFYYYYRHIYQKRAAIKLKYLKWLALLFQLYFFGMLALVLVRILFFSDRAFDPVRDLMSFMSVSAIQFLVPLILLAPPIMVCAAFKLRTRNRGFMTSRAKEPPLLAHLVRYTTNKGLIRGALQSLFFTWRKFVLLMLPCIVTSVALLICYAAFFAESPWAIAPAFSLILSAGLFLVTLSLFFVMQFFCYRMDSVMVMIGVGALALVQFIGGIEFDFFNHISENDLHLWITMTAALIPSYAFAIVYFPLAAADTNEFGLGKLTSKRIRLLLYTLAGIFFAMLFAENSLFYIVSDESSYMGPLNPMVAANYKSFTFLHAFFSWGLAICISCLLVTSVSFTSQQAVLLRQSRTERMTFVQKLFDPASAWSLLPIVMLEILFLAISSLSFRHFYLRTNDFRGGASFAMVHTVSSYAMQIWTVMHIGLISRQNNLIMDPWESHVPFNRICMFFFIFIPLGIVLNRITIGRAIILNPSLIFYFGSLFAFVMAKRCAPSERAYLLPRQDRSSGESAPEQEDSAS